MRLWYRTRELSLDEIPADQVVWRAVNKVSQIDRKTGDPKPSFFRDKRGLSCELALFTTVKRALEGAGVSWPPGTGLREFHVSDIQEASGEVSTLKHAPLPENYAHSEVHPVLPTGATKEMVRRSRYRVEPDTDRLKQLDQE